MNAISTYLNGIKKRYPDTQAVREQIEELKDMLNMKTEEYKLQGKPYEQAEREAIDSLGDVSPLMDEVAGDARTVYINHLRRNTAAFMFLLVLLEMFTAWILFRYILSDYYYLAYNIPMITFIKYLPFVLILLGIGIWLLIALFIWKRNPMRAVAILFDYKKMLIKSLIEWLLISVIITLVCIAFDSTISFYGQPPLAISILIPILFALNLPLSVMIYHKLFTCGHYDVK